MVNRIYTPSYSCTTVEPVLKDHPIGHKNVVHQDRWWKVTGSVILKYKSFCQKSVVCEDRWSLMAVVFQDRFRCIDLLVCHVYAILYCYSLYNFFSPSYFSCHQEIILYSLYVVGNNVITFCISKPKHYKYLQIKLSQPLINKCATVLHANLPYLLSHGNGGLSLCSVPPVVLFSTLTEEWFLLHRVTPGLIHSQGAHVRPKHVIGQGDTDRATVLQVRGDQATWGWGGVGVGEIREYTLICNQSI